MVTRRMPVRRVAAAVVVTATLAGCSTTVEDDTAPTISLEGGLQPADESAVPLDSEIVVDATVPPTTDAIEGTASDLLPELGIEMSRLSAQIDTAAGDETIARINATWDAIRPEVETARPDLVNAIGVTVDMANTAVEANRPADADKAFSLLNDLIDSFVGDG